MGRLNLILGAVILLVAGGAGAVFWSVWRQATAIRDYPALACRFDRFACTLPGCAALPDRFTLIPRGDHDRAALWMEGRPSKLSVMRLDGAREYFNGDNDRGNLTLTLRGLDFDARFQPDPRDTAQVGTGAGTCLESNTAELRT